MSGPAAGIRPDAQVPPAAAEPAAAAPKASASSNPRGARPVGANAEPQVFRLSTNLSDLWNKVISCFSAEINDGADLAADIGAQQEGLKGLKREGARIWKQIKDLGTDFIDSIQTRVMQLLGVAQRVLNVGFKFKFQMPPIELPAVEVGVSANGINIDAPAAPAAAG